MRRLLPYWLLATGYWLASATPALADAGTITVTVRNEFATTIASGSKVEYGCGIGFYSVSDGDANDQSSTGGLIRFLPTTAASCDDGDTLAIRVYDIGDIGYLDWSSGATFTTGADNPFTSANRFSILLLLQSEYGTSIGNISSVTPAASFASTQTTTGGTLAPSKDKIGFAIPVGQVAGDITTSGLGTIGYLNWTLDDVPVPLSVSDPQSVVGSKNPYTLLVVGRDEVGANMAGSGGDATWHGSSQIVCPISAGTARWGCPVPVGSAAASVTVSRPGYVQYTTAAVSIPISETGTQIGAETRNPYTIRVLGIGSSTGENLSSKATSTATSSAFLANTDILAIRPQNQDWLIAAVPGGFAIQLTAVIPGFQNTATAVQISGTGQAQVDFDDDAAATHWTATFDGPPLFPDVTITVRSDAGVPVAGASVTMYTTSTMETAYIANDLASGLAADAARQTGTDGIARFAMDTGVYWMRIVRPDGQVFTQTTGFIESGGAYYYAFGAPPPGGTTGGTGTGTGTGTGDGTGTGTGTGGTGTGPSVSPGSLIKLANDGIPGTDADTTVWYVAKDWKRYFFPNDKIYRTWVPTFSGVQIVTAATLASVPFGGPVRYSPGSRLIKVQSRPEIYAVAKGAVLRWVKDAAVASALYGAGWATTLTEDLSDAFLPHYTIGGEILTTGDFIPSNEAASAPTIDRDLGLE